MAASQYPQSYTGGEKVVLKVCEVFKRQMSLRKLKLEVKKAKDQSRAERNFQFVI